MHVSAHAQEGADGGSDVDDEEEWDRNAAYSDRVELLLTRDKTKERRFERPVELMWEK